MNADKINPMYTGIQQYSEVVKSSKSIENLFLAFFFVHFSGTLRMLCIGGVKEDDYYFCIIVLSGNCFALFFFYSCFAHQKG